MIQAERTPNPHSLKFTTTTGRFSGNEIVSVSSPSEVERHPLGEALFEIEGVEDVFITPEFVTVSKEAAVDWEDLKGAVESALTEYLEAQADS